MPISAHEQVSTPSIRRSSTPSITITDSLSTKPNKAKKNLPVACAAVGVMEDGESGFDPRLDVDEQVKRSPKKERQGEGADELVEYTPPDEPQTEYEPIAFRPRVPGADQHDTPNEDLPSSVLMDSQQPTPHRLKAAPILFPRDASAAAAAVHDDDDAVELQGPLGEDVPVERTPTRSASAPTHHNTYYSRPQESSHSQPPSSQTGSRYVPKTQLSLPFEIRDYKRPTAGERLMSGDPRSGRIIDLDKHASRRHTNYYVTAWQQACLKYIFPGAFEEAIDYKELIAIAILFITVILNMVTVSINVFGEQVESNLDSIRITGNVVFIFELIIVYLAFVFLFVVVLYGIVKKSYGTDYVVDIIDVAKIVASFSVLKVIRVASISFIQERLIPRFQMAVSCWDYIRAVIFVIGWAVLTVVAGGAVILKVSQVYFTGVISIEDWTIGQVVQLIGLVSNLAKVDTSYDAETAALLSSVHKHYRGPGGPDSLDPKNEGLYSLILTKLNIPRSRSYELFEAVFDFHFGKEDHNKKSRMKDEKGKKNGDNGEDRNEGKDATSKHSASSVKDAHKNRTRAMKAFNFMAFILHVDNQSLRRYLQMVESPLKFYADGNKAFSACVMARDVPGMEMMLWRSDPDYESTLVRGEKLPNTFRLTFTCEDPFVTSHEGEDTGVELTVASDGDREHVREVEMDNLKRSTAVHRVEEEEDAEGCFGGFFSCCTRNGDAVLSIHDDDDPTPTPRAQPDNGIWSPDKKLTKRTLNKTPAANGTTSTTRSSPPAKRGNMSGFI